VLIPYTRESYDLLHKGAVALSQVEAAGIRIDLGYLDRISKRVDRKISHLESKILKSELGRKWRKRYGSVTNLNSNKQLGVVLFDDMGFTCHKRTASGGYSTDEYTLSTIDHPTVSLFREVNKWKTTLSRNSTGLRREIGNDGMIHPFFSLHTAKTYRSSSNAPNFQNLPIRDPEMGKLIRSMFVARKGRQIVEVDYSGIEVRIAACYHKDPEMISYIEDKTKDLHRDMAGKCYMLPTSEITKTIRYCGKNMFVFPQFYGDWYIDNTRRMWDAIKGMNLVTESGVSLDAHLRRKGITERGRLDPKEKPTKGTFEYHIRNVERWFWNEKFKVYSRWKRNWYEAYRKRGWIKTKTGFICQGFMKKNEVINYPVQGSAFHCLLWSLTRLVRIELRKRKMKTLIVGQIHDSIVADVVASELSEYLHIIDMVMTKLLAKTWDWIIVPLEIEIEVAPVGGTWADKQPWKGN
jgi:DNA polymerase-1